MELEHRYFIYTVDRIPVTLVKGEGARIWDDNGHVYLDFVAGWAVNSLGHCHPIVAEAVAKQVQTLIQTSNQFYTIPQLELAEILTKNSCLDKAYFCNSGAEANEGAVKLARRYGALKLDGAYEVITALNSFHGRTLAMTAATGQAKFQNPYSPLPVGFKNVPYNDVAAIKAIPDDNYLVEVMTWCNKNGILFILDEIQTGIGRTGTLFAYEQYGIEPDIMTLAKGLASGLPIGAIVAKDKANVFIPGDHGSTFGGNCLTCAAAYATVKYIIDNSIADCVKEVGIYFSTGLERLKKKFDFVTDIRGRGLLLAMEFDCDIAQSV
jgi:acetylornithine/succinyldiaminopimelate/putrescine aminotransferase